jgi:hypothetical protein
LGSSPHSWPQRSQMGAHSEGSGLSSPLPSNRPPLFQDLLTAVPRPYDIHRPSRLVCGGSGPDNQALPSAVGFPASPSRAFMTETVAYPSAGDYASIELKSSGVALSIQKGGNAVGTLFVAKSGIRWRPKGKFWARKSKKVVGFPLSWSNLDEMAAKTPQRSRGASE